MCDCMHESVSRAATVAVKTDDELQQKPAAPGHHALRSASIASHADLVRRASDSEPASAERAVLQLQRAFGNRYAARVVSVARQANEPEVDGEVEESIHAARGTGQVLDGRAREQMEQSIGGDFAGVRVHTDAQADALNQALQARAFTTGQDIFFREGEYDPGSSSGRELLAHELTHVVQQTGSGLQRKMTVSQPGDPFEREADETARRVMQQEHQFTTDEESENTEV